MAFNLLKYFPALSLTLPCGLVSLLLDTDTQCCSSVSAVATSYTGCDGFVLLYACLYITFHPLLTIADASKHMYVILIWAHKPIIITERSAASYQGTTPPPNHMEYFQHVSACLTRTVSCCAACVNNVWTISWSDYLDMVQSSHAKVALDSLWTV